LFRVHANEIYKCELQAGLGVDGVNSRKRQSSASFKINSDIYVLFLDVTQKLYKTQKIVRSIVLTINAYKIG
jgi:hypothetical protein